MVPGWGGGGLSSFGLGEEGHGGLQGELADATGACLGDEEEAAGGDHVDPAAGAGRGQFGGGGTGFEAGAEVHDRGVAGAEEQAIAGGAEGAAAMARADEVPGGGTVGGGKAAAGAQVVDGGFGDEVVAEDDGVVDLFAVGELAGDAGEVVGGPEQGAVADVPGFDDVAGVIRGVEEGAEDDELFTGGGEVEDVAGFGDGSADGDFPGGVTGIGVDGDEPRVALEEAGEWDAADGIGGEVGGAGFDEEESVGGEGEGGVEDDAVAAVPLDAAGGGVGAEHGQAGDEGLVVVVVAVDQFVAGGGAGGGGLLGGAEEVAVAEHGVAPVERVGFALGNGDGEAVGHRAGGGVDDPAGVADGDGEGVGLEGLVAGVVGHGVALGIREVEAPEGGAVEGVDGDQLVFAGDDESALGGEGCGAAEVAVDHEIGAGSAEPLEGEVGVDALVAAAGGVGGVGELVGPLAGAVERTAAGRGGVGMAPAEAAEGAGDTFQFGVGPGELGFGFET